MARKPNNPYYAGPPSPHFDGVRFSNADGTDADRSLGDVLRWQRERPTRWPRRVKVTPVRPEPRVEGLRVTMVGHSTTLIQAGGLNVLTDPVWSNRAGPFGLLGPRRVTTPGIAFDDLPKIDIVLLSHNHYDHLDLATLARLEARDRPVFVMPLGNDTLVARKVTRERIRTGDWGDTIPLDGGAEVHLVPANHWSSRKLSDRRMALWCGFMVRTGAGLIYYAGDTGYGSGTPFRDMRARHGAPDLALIPIGAYAPRWFMAPQHCDPDEAVRIALDLGAARAVGVHWGTFRLTHEGRDEPPRLLEAATLAAGKPADWFRAAHPGEAYDF